MAVRTPTVRPTSWRWIVGLAVLLVLGATCAAAAVTRDQIRDTQEARLAYESRQLDAALAERMLAYEQILWGGVALFLASDDVSREEWVDYVATLRLNDRYPGFKSLSFAPAVPEDQLEAFVERVRREPVPGDIIDPALIRSYTPRSPTGVPGETDLHSPILYVAPFSAENQIVLGVDMMQDPTRREVMLAAVAADAARLSPLLRLAGQSDHRAGFIAYLPVQVGGDLAGWLTAAFRADDFMRGLAGELASTVEFEITDGEGGLLYSTEPASEDGSPVPLGTSADLARTSEVEMPGRSWEVRYVATEEFATATEQAAVVVVLGGGLLITVLVGAVGITGGGWRRRALQIEAQRAAVAERESVIRHQATHDALTGLANRSHFLEALAEAIASGPVGLAYLDIDGFKPINDDFGHRVGDALLVAIAERLAGGAPEGDVVARLGGDEFAVLLRTTEARLRDIDETARDLVALIDEPFELIIGGVPHRVEVSASVGIATYPADAADADALVHAADTAMFGAKRAGGGRRHAASGPVPAPAPGGATSR